MKVQISNGNIRLWLSADDTYDWAHKTGAIWPCSKLAGKRLFAEFDANGLVDYRVNGRDGIDIPSDEFNAITSDFLRVKLPEDHPLLFCGCWPASVTSVSQLWSKPAENNKQFYGLNFKGYEDGKIQSCDLVGHLQGIRCVNDSKRNGGFSYCPIRSLYHQLWWRARPYTG